MAIENLTAGAQAAMEILNGPQITCVEAIKYYKRGKRSERAALQWRILSILAVRVRAV